MLSRELLFFFSALGVFNSLLLSLYILFFSKKNRSANTLLGLLILALSIRVGVSCIYFFDHAIDYWLIQLGLSANVLAGVFLVEYLEINPAKGRGISTSSIYHMLGIGMLVIAGGFLFPFSENRFFWDHQLRYVLHGILTLYVIAAAFILKKRWTEFSPMYNRSDFEMKQVLVFGAFLLTCASFILSLYVNYILGPILFSFIFYSVCLGYFYLKNSGKISPPKYAKKKISTAEAELMLSRLHQLMKGEKLCKKSNLKISDLAGTLHISTHQLSQLLNDNLGKRFSDFVNTYRIEEAKELLLDKPEQTIESIAYEVGFNAKSSFYTTFKSLTGQTPAAFKAAQLALKGSKL